MTTLKLKPEIKTRFVEALRSNKYPQGMGRLRGQDSFCCLGVLADLAVQDGLARWEESDLVVDGSCFGTLFPGQLLSWACESNPANPNEDTDFPLSKNGPNKDSLARANDEDGMSFEEIACLVEKYL